MQHCFENQCIFKLFHKKNERHKKMNFVPQTWHELPKSIRPECTPFVHLKWSLFLLFSKDTFTFNVCTYYPILCTGLWCDQTHFYDLLPRFTKLLLYFFHLVNASNNNQLCPKDEIMKKEKENNNRQTPRAQTNF